MISHADPKAERWFSRLRACEGRAGLRGSCPGKAVRLCLHQPGLSVGGGAGRGASLRALSGMDLLCLLCQHALRSAQAAQGAEAFPSSRSSLCLPVITRHPAGQCPEVLPQLILAVSIHLFGPEWHGISSKSFRFPLSLHHHIISGPSLRSNFMSYSVHVKSKCSGMLLDTSPFCKMDDVSEELCSS